MGSSSIYDRIKHVYCSEISERMLFLWSALTAFVWRNKIKIFIIKGFSRGECSEKNRDKESWKESMRKICLYVLNKNSFYKLIILFYLHNIEWKYFSRKIKSINKLSYLFNNCFTKLNLRIIKKKRNQ